MGTKGTPGCASEQVTRRLVHGWDTALALQHGCALATWRIRHAGAPHPRAASHARTRPARKGGLR